MSLSCCQYGGVKKDANLSAVSIKHANICELRSERAVLDHLTVHSINNVLIDGLVSRQTYIPVLQASAIDATFTPAKYINFRFLNDNNNVGALDVAQHFRLPTSITHLYATIQFFSAGSGDVGFLSVQLANPITGEPLPGEDNPAFIGEAIEKHGILATQTLLTPLPANTPFVVRMKQTGSDGNGRYRYTLNAVSS